MNKDEVKPAYKVGDVVSFLHENYFQGPAKTLKCKIISINTWYIVDEYTYDVECDKCIYKNIKESKLTLC